MTSSLSNIAQLRARRDEDLAELESILAVQQPTTRYPFRWPLPFPTREFIVRPAERAAWVSVNDEAVTGHVSVTGVEPDPMSAAWSQGTGLPLDQLECVSVLFVDQSTRGTGIGGLLLETAEQWIFDRGRTAVLDVVQKYTNALSFYSRRGWREVGEARPPWLPPDEPPVILMAKDPSRSK